MADIEEASEASAEIHEMDNMDDFLYYVLEVDHDGMRELIIYEGFRNLRALLRHDRKWVTQARLNVRKSPVGDPQAKNMSGEHELNLWKAVLWAKYSYITQRGLDYNLVTWGGLQRIYEWHLDLEVEMADTTVATFSATLNKRTWFESIESYLTAKKGAAGFPLSYVITNTADVDGDEPFPRTKEEFHEDLASRGRHNGIYWSVDNRTVWRLMESKCRGTPAWSTISQFEPTANGRAAHRALRNHYMGEDLVQVLRTKADTLLKHSKFDGKSRNYTLDAHINRFRQAFIDLGPDDQPSDKRKVEWFLNSWQVPGKDHLASTVRRDPLLKASFDATCEYLMLEMAQPDLKNAGTPSANRSVAAMEIDSTSRSKSRSRSKKDSKSKDKSKKGKKGKSKFSKPANKKFNQDDPAAYVTADAWRKMTKEQQQAARDKRREQGLPSRNVSGITSHREVSAATSSVTFGGDSEQLSFDVDDSPEETKKHTTVRVATLSQMQPTRGQQSRGPTKETQMSDRARAQLEISQLKRDFEKRMEELSQLLK